MIQIKSHLYIIIIAIKTDACERRGLCSGFFPSKGASSLATVIKSVLMVECLVSVMPQLCSQEGPNACTKGRQQKLKNRIAYLPLWLLADKDKN